jgi:DNA-binding CsgD family transcriptional regulator
MVRQMISSLTPTETHVAGMISRGYPTKLIAAEMQRSENTVKIHRHRIFNKLKVSTAASVANLVRHLVD